MIFGLLLALFAAPAQSSPVAYDVKRFGAKGDGVTLDRVSINAAVEACSKNGGGTVYVPAGTYLSGTITLRDNVTLWLDSGATLLATRDLSQYDTAVAGQVWYQALILAKDAHNVAVIGRGTIDGNKVRNPAGEERMRGPHSVLFFNTRDAAVRDVLINDAGNYSVIVRSSERLNIDGITVRGGWDGINMHDTRNATIANCRIFSGDDSLAGAYWENVTVSNCVLNSSANTIRVGGRNVLFNNLLMYGPGEFPAGTSQRHRLEAGFQILPQRAIPKGETRLVAPGPVDNMVISNVTMINVGTPIYIAFSSDASYSANSLGVGRITFNNVTVTGAGLVPVYVSAPAENPARSIVLNNVRIAYKDGVDESRAQSQGFSPFSVLQAYGIYCRNVRALELHDVRIEKHANEHRSAILADNVGVVELDRFRAERDAGGPPIVQLSGSGALIVDGKPEPAVRMQNVELHPPAGLVRTGEPFWVRATVRSDGGRGLLSVPLKVGADTIERRIWVQDGSPATVSFLNLRRPSAGPFDISVAGRSAKAVALGRESQPVASPYETFANTKAEFMRSAAGFFIRAAGDYPLQQFGDQYGSIFLPQSLPPRGTLVVKLENPDLRTNWVGRAGIIVRREMRKPDQSTGYVVLASSPAAGASLEWDSNNDGRLDEHTNFDGNTFWPLWLKLERDGTRFTGYSSNDGEHWTKVGEASVDSAAGILDAGLFAYRDSAQFDDFRIDRPRP